MRYDEEYSALRNELLKRFDIFYSIVRYGITGFVILVYFYLTKRSPLPDNIALLILQLISLLIAVSSFVNFRNIYNIGTYLAIFYEQRSGPKWHRMRRQFHDYKKNSTIKNNTPSHKAYTYFEKIFGWGSEPRLSSILTLCLGLFSYLFVSSKNAMTFIWQMKETSDQLICIVNSVLSIFLAILIMLLYKMDYYRKNIENDWIQYSKSFGRTYIDKYGSK